MRKSRFFLTGLIVIISILGTMAVANALAGGQELDSNTKIKQSNAKAIAGEKFKAIG